LSDQTVVAQRTVADQGVLFLVDADTGAVSDGLGGVVGAVPALSPDRRSILYLSTNEQQNSALRVIGSDGSGDRWLFDAPPVGCEKILRPAWNPMDPNEIAAACYNADNTGLSLNVIGLDGTLRRTLDVGQDTVDDPAWSPDGSTLTFWAGPSTALGGGAIYTMAADGESPPVQLTDGTGSDADPIFSPDGTEIAFRRWNFDATGKNTDVDIVVMSVDGSNVRTLAKHPGNDQDPAWSPDGKQFVWKSSRGAGDSVGLDHYWVMDVNGQNIHRLDPEDGIAEQSAPAWGRR
jgi:Tol biopolymer transport system component